MSVIKKDKGTYVVRYRVNGRQKQKSFGKGEQAKLDAEAFDDLVLNKKRKDKENKKLYGNVPTTVEYIDELASIYFADKKADEEKDWVRDWKKMLNKLSCIFYR